jgi:hypothetical protein
MKRLVILLFISLAGCSLPKKLDFTCDVEPLPHDAMTLDSIILPSPIELDTINDLTATPEGVTLNSAHIQKLTQWQHEIDRYLRDLRTMWLHVQKAVEEHNNLHGVPEED